MLIEDEDISVGTTKDPFYTPSWEKMDLDYIYIDNIYNKFIIFQ